MVVRRTLGLGLALAILLPAVIMAVTAGAAPGSTRSRYFSETGYTTSGSFLDYWERNGGLYIFGYPITAEIQDTSTDGNVYLTQYFERAIFEYHPEYAGTRYEVLLRLLGLIQTQGRAFDVAPEPHHDTSGRRYFPYYGGHSLAGVFLDYWEGHGGLPVFGYPISEQFYEVSPTDGQTYLVQYFERNRFEYHPENAGTPYEVLLGLLGYEYLQQMQGGGGLPQPPVSPTPPLPAPPPGGSTGLGYGFCVHLTGANLAGTLDQVEQAGFGWIRQQVHWADIEPLKGTYNWGFLDQIVSEANARGLRVLFSVVWSPVWATSAGGHGMPADPRDFGDFLSAMASRYAGRNMAYEIWNEENYAVENDGYVAGPGRYVELLKEAYTRIKAADPGATVVCGALTPTGVSNPRIAIDDIVYLKQMLSYDGGVIRHYFDVLGAHVAGTLNPPDTLWPANPGPGPGWVDHPTHYFRHVENIRATMVAYGMADKPIWLTEFGWSATQNVTAKAAPGYEYGYYNSEQEQAEYLVRALEKGRTEYQPWMGAMFVWNLNFATVVAPTDEKAPFSLIRPDGSTRPAYTALAGMPR